MKRDCYRMWLYIMIIERDQYCIRMCNNTTVGAMNYLAERQVIHMDMTGRWRNAVLFAPMIKWKSEKKVKQLESKDPL